MQETRLQGSRNYKGAIRWFKLKFRDGRCKVEKRRLFGNDSYKITPEEYDWITDARKAREMWDFYHYIGTAYWFSGELKHPMTGEGYVKENAA